MSSDVQINQMEFSEQEHANKSGRESCGENQQESQLQTSQEQKEVCVCTIHSDSVLLLLKCLLIIAMHSFVLPRFL